MRQTDLVWMKLVGHLQGIGWKQAPTVEALSDKYLDWWLSTRGKIILHNVQRHLWLSELKREGYWHVVGKGQGCC